MAALGESSSALLAGDISKLSSTSNKHDTSSKIEQPSQQQEDEGVATSPSQHQEGQQQQNCKETQLLESTDKANKKSKSSNIINSKKTSGKSKTKAFKESKSKKTKDGKKVTTATAAVAQEAGAPNALVASSKPKSMVDELKLFQNNQHLLDQQDPLQQLHLQLNELIHDENPRSFQLSSTGNNNHQSAHQTTVNQFNGEATNGVLPAALLHHHQLRQQQATTTTAAKDALGGNPNGHLSLDDSDENIFTIKKGVLWQQQNSDKFHQRLFSRWKKRYFILTTDYLVCFKRSTSKVGHSEMGKFLYKTSLSDVTKIEWLKTSKKSDKGSILLHTKQKFNLYLWSKENLDDWMFMISESIERNKVRRINCATMMQPMSPPNTVCNDDTKANSKTTDAMSSNGHLSSNHQRPLSPPIRLNPLVDQAIEEDGLYENTPIVSRDTATSGQQNQLPIVDGNIKLTRLNELNNNNIIVANDVVTASDYKSSQASAKYFSNNNPSTDEASLNKLARSHLQSALNAGEESNLNVHQKGKSTTDDQPLSINDNDERSIRSAAEPFNGEKKLIERGQGKDSNDIIDSQPSATSTRESVQVKEVKGKRTKASGRSQQKKEEEKEQTSMINGCSIQHAKSSEDNDQEANEDDAITKSNLSSELQAVTPVSANSSTGGSSRQSSLRDKKRAKNEPKLVSKKNKNTESSGQGKIKNSSEEEEGGDKSESVKCNRISSHIKSSKRKTDGEIDINSGIDSNNNNNNSKSSSERESEKVSLVGSSQQHNNQKQQQRPPANLIRRDDSWQSLVSLTRVGKVTPSAIQVAQRSLYAKQIMPDNDGIWQQQQLQHYNSVRRQQTSNYIESTITPSRAAPMLLRQQSAGNPPPVQMRRNLRALPGIGAQHQQQQHSASFDVAPNSPLQQPMGNHQLSYQQKLLQLQLLHNSNNVDYIRHGGGDPNSDYQIYRPESTVNHYGYSSMLSNLKSAASEFSFIRPSASSHHNQVATASSQSTLPHQASLQAQRFHLVDNQITQRSSLLLADSAHLQSDIAVPNNSNDDPLMACRLRVQQQFLVNPTTGQRIINQQELQQQQQPKVLDLMAELTPPMRELPLKPNKKRTLLNDNHLSGAGGANSNDLPKSSSLTSSIACFFRRAFSRRSKKRSKRRSKLAESCSSSLGAFEDGYSALPAVPSAFSTGDGRKSQNSQQAIQSQRMVDMIEAFTNKTLAAAAEAEAAAGVVSGGHRAINISNNMDHFTATPKQSSAQLRPRQPHLNHFGSPLHKSNSISTTIGLSELTLANDVNGRRSLMYDNQMLGGNAPHTPGGCSPMLMRSNKVMSVNLTPLMSQREPNSSNELLHHHQQQLFMSPRNSSRSSGMGDHLPRPSSIYGQPSMISSPVMTREQLLDRSNNFGAHRSSLHGQQFRDLGHRSSNGGGGGERASIGASGSRMSETRRNHQIMQLKMPFLDTTREVAEELIASPTTDDGASVMHNNSKHLEGYRGYDSHVEQSSRGQLGGYPMATNRHFDASIPSSPSSIELRSQQHHRQAIVNPILQSPTMNTIYDNHPMLSGGESSSYSHYDNHTNHLIMTNQVQQSPSMCLPKNSNSMTQFMTGGGSSSINTDHQDHYSRKIGVAAQIAQSPSTQMYTPTHLQHQHQQRFTDLDRSPALPGFHKDSGTKLTQMISSSSSSSGIKKPSAIVAPSSPSTSGHGQVMGDHTAVDYSGGRIHSSSNARSPMQSRRPVANPRAPQSHYQQSPLVSQQTRILNRADGVQATVIGDSRMATPLVGQPVINIAGAPGINLEPSLAASLLKGTNIDAYESSTFNRLANGSQIEHQQQQHQASNSKTFLVSTRLSKSMAYSHKKQQQQQQCSSSSSVNDNGSDSSSMFRGESGTTANAAAAPSTPLTSNITSRRSSRDNELSGGSSGSRSVNSSIGKGSLRVSSRKSSFNLGASSSQEDQQEESSVASSGGGGSGSGSSHESRSVKASSYKDNNNMDSHLIRNNKKASISSSSSIGASSGGAGSNSGNSSNNSRGSRRNRRESSSEPSADEIVSHVGSLEKPDERNWITSKLITD